MAGIAALLELWKGYAPFADAVEALRRGERVQVTGLSGSSPALVAAGVVAAVGRPCLVVTPGTQEARRLEAELHQYLPDLPVRFVPPRPRLGGEVLAASREWEHLRVEAFDLAHWASQAVLIAPAETARQLLLPWPETRAVELAVGTVVAPETVVARLVALGYTRENAVTVPGQFARRGAILDVWGPGAVPVRVEWFGDEVESVRAFDPDSQRTVSPLDRARIGPARELLWTPAQRDRAVRRLAQESEELVQNLRALGKTDWAERAHERFGRYLADLTEDRPFAGLSRFVAGFGTPVPLTAIFARPPLVVVHDPARVLETLRAKEAEEAQDFAQRQERGDALPMEAEASLPADATLSGLKGAGEAWLSLMPWQREAARHKLTLTGRPAPRVHGQEELFRSEIEHLRKARLKVVLVVRDGDAARWMQGVLAGWQIPVQSGVPRPGTVGLLHGHIGPGFVLPELGLAVLGETELTGHESRPKVPRRTSAEPRLRLSELSEGDYVVHATHGIGRYVGIRTLEIQGQHKDYLHLEYAGGDTLYVPVDQLQLVQKYVGVEGQPPKLSRLGGNEWARVKERVRHSVRQMAEELVRLYAIRQARPGFAFGPDTPWQREFELAFPYEETEDQLKAIEEIKRDMERPRPMDRLLCGDVGYGKTEVALRAAFKAIMAGKQVAFLVPTTLLADQHYQTAKSRLAGYPVTVEVLSRFRTPKQQRQILEQLARGQIDLLIGTHRLLGKDVKFHDLGLLIVDEEHRFGVAHKERIKALKENVDVLTLTATPIPRTLHMAMVGIRDMSLIETPPEDRLPVETVVAEYDPILVREAIQREIDRGGQVFYVQNRIRAMDATVQRLVEMFPDLRIGVVHGQMEESRIEETMARFVEGEYDILVATNIIESGLDIPNANTLIVEDADRLGLAQLYQLRGRVGRSSRLAYAYFTYRPDKVLTPEAEKRLEAIREFTELGAGYQIALRDLEIRGAGNLLGSEQHGFIASVGFDLYTELLAEAIRELKGEPAPVEVDPQVELDVDAYLPDGYVPDARTKIELYKRLAAARDLETLEALEAEMVDRFGPLPAPVAKLVQLARIRALSRRLKIVQVSRRGDRILFRCLPEAAIDQEALVALARRFPGRLVPSGKAPELGLRMSPRSSPEAYLEAVETALRTLSGHYAHAGQASV
ncbi:MAG: transcription-repair coupling factor [Firmicutes bacterium]|nr:transcription-repair coupling factor [Alicyclobacillaceae bacterium]MCL6497210.1 transcription-repair coupling factor [Bacillota bacterium]